MAVDEKRAPRDLALSDEGAKLSSDVIEAHGMDYSGAIGISEQGAEDAANIFIPLVNISDDFVKLDETATDLNFKLDFNKQQMEDKEYEAQYKRLTENQINHDVYDKSIQARQELWERLKHAQENGYHESVEVEAWKEKYKPENLFPNSQAAQDLWNKDQYMPTYSSAIMQAMENDFKADQAQSANELATEQNIMAAQIAKGATPASAVALALKHTLATRKNYSYADNIKVMNQLYDSAFKIYAQKVIADAGPNGYAKAANILQDIIKKNGKMEVDALDANGKPIKNKGGKNTKVTLTLSSDTITSLMSEAGTLKNKSYSGIGGGSIGGYGNYGSDGLLGAMGTLVDIKSINKTGCSKFASNTSVDQCTRIFDQKIAEVNASNLPDNKKNKSVQGLESLKVRTVAACATAHIGNGRVAREAKQALSSGMYMDNSAAGYVGSVLKGLKAGEGLAGAIKAANTRRQIAKQVNKVVKQAPADFAYSTNSEIRESTNRLSSLFAIPHMSGQQKKMAIGELQNLRGLSNEYLGDSAYNTNSLSTYTLTNIIDTYNSMSGTEQERYTSDMAEVFAKAGYSDVIVDSRCKGKYSKEQQTVLDKIQSKIMERKTEPSYRSLVKDIKTANVSDSDLKEVAAANFEKNIKDSKSTSITNYAIQKVSEYDIPDAYRGAANSMVEDIVTMCSYKNKGKDEIERYTKSAMENNFIEIGSKYTKGREYSGSVYWGEDGATLEKVEQARSFLNRAGDRIDNEMKTNGIAGKIFNKKEITFSLDNASGSFTLYINGVRPMYSNESGEYSDDYSISLPNIENIKAPREWTREDIENRVIQHVGLQILWGELATNDSLRKEWINDHPDDPYVKMYRQNYREKDSSIDTNIDNYFQRKFQGMLAASSSSDYLNVAFAKMNDKNSFEIGDAPSGLLESTSYKEKADYIKDEYRKMAKSKTIIGNTSDSLFLSNIKAAENQKDIIKTFTNLAYAVSSYNNKVDTTENKHVNSLIARGDSSYTDVLSDFKKNGFALNSSNVYDPSTSTSFYLYRSNYLLDSAGNIKDSAMNSLYTMITKNPNLKSLNKIETSDDKLLNNKKFMSLKNSKGEPLVQKRSFFSDETSLISFTFDHNVGKDKMKNIEKGTLALTNDAYDTQSGYLPHIPRGIIQGVITGGIDLYNKKSGSFFGLCQLSKQEYKSYGLSDKQTVLPALQTRVAVNRTQQLLNVTGNLDVAVWSLYGGYVKDSSGRIYSAYDLIKKGKVNDNLDYYRYIPAKSDKMRYNKKQIEQLNNCFYNYKRFTEVHDAYGNWNGSYTGYSTSYDKPYLDYDTKMKKHYRGSELSTNY